MTALSQQKLASSPIGVRKRSNRITGSTKDKVAAGLRIAILTAWAAYFILPLYWLLLASTKSAGTLSNSAAFAIAKPQLFTNLGSLFSYEHGLFFQWALNSVLYSVAGAAVGTLMAGMAGYYLAMYRFRGREALFSVVLGGVLVPSTALALPLFLLFSQVHLTNTFWGVFLASIVNPFGFYLARLAAEASVPVELLEAARVDGAGDFRVFFSIASRLMVPGLITVFLTQFVGIWNNFLLPVVMLQNQNLYPITLGLYAWNSQQYAGQTPLQTIVITGSVVSIAPLVVAFIFLQRFWRSGLGAGGIKA
jgi:multiple sugar transport system permease protein